MDMLQRQNGGPGCGGDPWLLQDKVQRHSEVRARQHKGGAAFVAIGAQVQDQRRCRRQTGPDPARQFCLGRHRGDAALTKGGEVGIWPAEQQRGFGRSLHLERQHLPRQCRVEPPARKAEGRHMHQAAKSAPRQVCSAPQHETERIKPAGHLLPANRRQTGNVGSRQVKQHLPIQRDLRPVPAKSKRRRVWPGPDADRHGPFGLPNAADAPVEHRYRLIGAQRDMQKDIRTGRIEERDIGVGDSREIREKVQRPVVRPMKFEHCSSAPRALRQ